MEPNPTNGHRRIRDTPLADLAGSMSGEGWDIILQEIQKERQTDQEQLKQLYPLEDEV